MRFKLPALQGVMFKRRVLQGAAGLLIVAAPVATVTALNSDGDNGNKSAQQSSSSDGATEEHQKSTADQASDLKVEISHQSQSSSQDVRTHSVTSTVNSSVSSSGGKSSVTVNGQPVEVPNNGVVQRTVSNGDGQVNVNVQSSSSSSSGSSVSVDVDSSSQSSN